MQKLALIDGISYSVDMTKPVGKGVRGVIVIKSGKDRISEIEEHCAVSWSSDGSHPARSRTHRNQLHGSETHARHHRTPQHDAQR